MQKKTNTLPTAVAQSADSTVSSKPTWAAKISEIPPAVISLIWCLQHREFPSLCPSDFCGVEPEALQLRQAHDFFLQSHIITKKYCDKSNL